MSASLSFGCLKRLELLTPGDLSILQRLLKHDRSPEEVYQLIRANLQMVEALDNSEQRSSIEEEEESSVVDSTAKLTLQPGKASLEANPDAVIAPRPPVGISAGTVSRVTPSSRPSEMQPGVPWPTPGTQSGSMISSFISSRPQAYTVYHASAEDTGKPGPTRFRVSLGNNLYVCFPKQRPAEMLAKIARAHGVRHPMVAGRVFSWGEGSTPYPIDPSQISDGATHRDPESMMPEW